MFPHKGMERHSSPYNPPYNNTGTYNSSVIIFRVHFQKLNALLLTSIQIIHCQKHSGQLQHGLKQQTNQKWINQSAKSLSETKNERKLNAWINERTNKRTTNKWTKERRNEGTNKWTSRKPQRKIPWGGCCGEADHHSRRFNESLQFVLNSIKH